MFSQKVNIILTDLQLEKLKIVVIFRAELEYTIKNSMYKITVKLQRL